MLRGTIRSYDPSVRNKMQDGIRRTARATALMANAPEPDLKIVSGGEAVQNSAVIVDRTEGVLKMALGAAKVRLMQPISPSEDCSEYANAGVPAIFFLVGVFDLKDVEASRQPSGKPLLGNHSPFYQGVR